jgi:hypothetical protein
MKGMKGMKAHKISNRILWICTIIALIIFTFFYTAYIKDPEAMDVKQTDGVLIFSFALLFITCLITLFFSVYKLTKGGKNYFLKTLHSSLLIVMLGLLLFATYQLGNGEPLTILGYQGKENTYYWLKISDMWIYSSFILLGLAFLAVFSGVIWSYLKKK